MPRSVKSAGKPIIKFSRQSRARPSTAPQPPEPPLQAAPPTKADLVLGLLRQPGGTTVAALSKATGWQLHSVRGFLAGTVKKKRGLDLISEKVDGQRLYRLADEVAA